MAQKDSQVKNVVLVHGAWADGSSWSDVIEKLQDKGYKVTAPQFPLSSLANDVARLRQVLALQDGPTIVAGHSYGGQIMTALGTDAQNVVGLVYIAAFGIDQGESLGKLSQGPPTPALAHASVDKQGFMWLSEDDFVNHFAADVNHKKAKVMYAVQQPLAAAAFADVMGVPAWKSLPSWYMVATKDQAIPPDAERMFAKRMGATVVEVTVEPRGDDVAPEGDGRVDREGSEQRRASEVDGSIMPMIDVYAAADLFPAGTDGQLGHELTMAVLRAEGVATPGPFHLNNTAAFIHRMDPHAVHTAATDSARTVRVQIITPPGALSRDGQKQLVKEATEIVTKISGDPTQAGRTWVLLTEAAEGGWGLAGTAFGRQEFADLAAKAAAARQAK